MVTLKIKKLNPAATLPSYAHPGDAAMDLHALEEYVLQPGERKVFNLGIAVEFPAEYVALVWDKSGLAGNFGLKTMGGVIDSGYRGEWKVTLLNTSSEQYHIRSGDKIAQALIQPIVHPEIEEVAELSDTSRGQGGFGSTGK